MCLLFSYNNLFIIKLHFFCKPNSLIENIVRNKFLKFGLEEIESTKQLTVSDNCLNVLFCDDLNDELFTTISSLQIYSSVLVIGLKDNKQNYQFAKKVVRAGSVDFLSWESESITPDEIFYRIKRWSKVEELLKISCSKNAVIGNNKLWKNVIRKVVEVAYFTLDSILITGESGTGKEVIANLIHDLDPKQNKGKYVILDCTTIVPELSGSEFFGHERGAFTGAVNSRKGAFEIANGGTLFLDEIGDLPLTLQSQLLRVMQEGTYQRVGSSVWRKTKFRLISATNRDIKKDVAQGNFRSDLYFRITNWLFKLPSLSERRDDILLLVEHFLNQFNNKSTAFVLDQHVMDFLYNRNYPGNVRELKHLVLKIAHLASDRTLLSIGCIPEEDFLSDSEEDILWPDRDLESSLRRALFSGNGLTLIIEKIREMALQIVINDVLKKQNGNQIKKEKILSDAANQLQCSKRWAQQLEKKYETLKNIIS